MRNANKFENQENINGQSGLTLIELTFSMLTFLMVTGSVFALLELGRVDRNRASRQSDTLKNSRAAMYLVGREVMNAGLGFHKKGAFVPDGLLNARMGTPMNTTNPTTHLDRLTSVSVANDVDANSIVPALPNDSIAFLSRDLQFFAGDPNNLGEIIKANDEVSVQNDRIILKTTPGKTQYVALHDLFLAETDVSQVVVMVTDKDDANDKITFAAGDPLGLNQVRAGALLPKNNSLLKKCATADEEGCTDYDPALGIGVRLKKINWVKYRIDNTGALIRTTFGNNRGAPAAQQIQNQELIYGVKQMQITYTLDDSTVVDDPAAGLNGIRGDADDDQTRMNNIRQVTFNLTVEAETPDEQMKIKDDVTLTTTFSTRNLQYDDR